MFNDRIADKSEARLPVARNVSFFISIFLKPIYMMNFEEIYYFKKYRKKFEEPNELLDYKSMDRKK